MVCHTVIDPTTGDRAERAHRGRYPGWVPQPVRHYIAHTESGISIRQLAREAGCHASTILRQVRRYETLRDDALVDDALVRLGRLGGAAARGDDQKELPLMKPVCNEDFLPPVSDAVLNDKAMAILRHLARPGTVLAVASDMDKGVVVRDRVDGSPERLDVVSRALAEAMVLKDWIGCSGEGRVSRYTITTQGRTALNRLIAKRENAARGFAEGMAHFDMRGARPAAEEAEGDEGGRLRGVAADTPVAALARRRDRDGSPFLRPELVRAGERLREDFELAQIGPRMAQDWDRFLTAGTSSGAPRGERARGPEAARQRVDEALRELGPGLGDVVLRCCCQLEGLETAERKMGWSARSAKIVLRIALERLHRHYSTLPRDSGLIG